MAIPNIPEGFDFTDPDVYAEGIPRSEFAELRKTAPVWWNPQSPAKGGYADEGFWVVTKHHDVKEISRNSKVYSTRENTAIVRFADGMERDTIDTLRYLLINMDAPEHTKLRKLVSRGFTPRAIASMREALATRARTIVTEAAAHDQGDFVTQLAAELPLQAIAELIGVPQEDRGKLFNWSNQMMGYDDPQYAAESANASAEILAYSYNLAEERRKCPANDILTTLIEADVDGNELSSEEFGFFVLMLAVAGNETTRNAITHGMIAFLENPEQWELFRKERPATTADEIVRYATPVTSFQRTAMVGTEIHGQEIKKGDRVAMFYASANFDEDVFENPLQFDITRDPNPHLGFGGTGEHFCIGANLARLEIDLIFGAIADFLPDIAALKKPTRLRSGWINGIKEFQVDYQGGCPIAH